MKGATVVMLAGALGVFALTAQQARATSHGRADSQGSGVMGQHMISPGLIMPSMDAARGRIPFASKGCVVCHSINGVGGEDAAARCAKHVDAYEPVRVCG